MFYTGLRLGEIISLHRKDFDFEKKEFKLFMSKTKKERIMFFTEKVEKALQEYFTSDPETLNAFNLSYNAVRYIVFKLAGEITDVHVHPHLFRHSFAISLLRNGVDISVVSKLLGHSNITTTQRYLGLYTEELKEEYMAGWKK
jgi:site-specific recombinase XerD